MCSSFVSIEEFEETAKHKLPRDIFEYFSLGALSNATVKENKTAINRWYIVPRVLRDISRRSLTTSVFGREVAVPFAIAPTAMHCMAHPDGECATARACARHGTIFTLSTSSNSSLQEVVQAAPHCIKFFQLYIYKNRKVSEDIVRQAEQAGYSALVLTVDSAVLGIRRADVRNNFAMPAHLRLRIFDNTTAKEETAILNVKDYCEALHDPSITWADIAWLTSITKMPVVVKGIMCSADARLALAAGVAAIWVSNHGGRQADCAPPTIESLVAVAAEVRGRCPVFVDGGFTQGTDVFKALALGADMVFIGRPVLWGLACGGEDGVFEVLKIIRDELDNTMANTGCCSIKDITSDMVVRREQFAKL